MGTAGVNSSLSGGVEAAALFAVLAATTAWPAPARAQETAEEPQPEPGAGAVDEVILDPELSGIAPPPEPTPAEQPAAAATPNGEVRAQLHSRVALDTRRDASREDLWEATQVGLIEARVRRSDKLRFALGLRVRHQYAVRRADTPEADRERATLDLAPTAGYGDATVADGLHLRLGYQSVRLGNFELLNGSDVLSVYDLRSGPTTFPEAFEIAQLAARVDWDVQEWLSLGLTYVPFFQPHRVHVFDGNYALYPQGVLGEFESSAAQRELRRTLSRAAQSRLADEAYGAFAPDPNLGRPQAALQAVAHGAEGELRLTAALARDQIFTTSIDPTLELEYEPFGLFSIEGTTEVGPVAVGAQLAYMLQRTVPTDYGDAGTLLTTDRTDVTHLGIRVEHAQGDLFGFLIEASASGTLDSGGRSGAWLEAHDRHWYLALAGVAQLVLDPVTIELSGGLINGPSYVLAPRGELELFEGLYLEVGGYLVGAVGTRMSRGHSIAGDLFEHADQAFVGARWVP
jgi:hypothetical protein